MTINEIFNNKFVGARIEDIGVIRPFVKRKYISPKQEYKRLDRLIRRVYRSVLFNRSKLMSGNIGKWFGVRMISTSARLSIRAERLQRDIYE